MPLLTQCGTGEGLAGKAFLGGDQAYGTHLFLQTKARCFACLRVSVLWRHKGAAAHSADNIQPNARQRDGCIHGNPTWRPLCALKDSMGIGIQKWKSRTGPSNLDYSLKTYPSCKLLTCTLSSHCWPPAWSGAVPAQGENPADFHGRGLGQHRRDRIRVSLAHFVLWTSLRSKMQVQILPFPSHFRAASLLTQHFQSPRGFLPTNGVGSKGWGTQKTLRQQTSQTLHLPRQTRGWGGHVPSQPHGQGAWGQCCCFQRAGLDGSLPCLLKHFQLNPVEFNLLLLINFSVSLPTPLRTPRRYYSKHNRKGLFFSANFLTEEASMIPPSRIRAIRIHEN